MLGMVPRMFSFAVFTLVSISLFNHFTSASPLESPAGSDLGVNDENPSDDVDKRGGRSKNVFLRIGKSVEDDEDVSPDLIEDDDVVDPEKRAISRFLRIGRAPSRFVRIGKAGSGFVRIGKAGSSFLRIGKAGSSFVRIGKDSDPKRVPSSFVRIGKSDGYSGDNVQKRRNAFIRIGKIPSSAYLRMAREYGFGGLEKTPISYAQRSGNRQSQFVRIGKRSVDVKSV